MASDTNDAEAQNALNLPTIHNQHLVEDAYALAQAWKKAPGIIKSKSFEDLKVSCDVHRSWNTCAALKQATVKSLQKAGIVDSLRRRHPALRAKKFQEILESLFIVHELNKISLFRRTALNDKLQTFRIAASCEKISALKHASLQDFRRAEALVAEWKRSPMLKSKTPAQLKNAYAKITAWEKTWAGKKGQAFPQNNDWLIMQAWKKSKLLRTVTPEDLQKAARLLEARKKVPFLQAKNPSQLTQHFILLDQWKKNSALRKFSAGRIVEAYEVAKVCERAFGNMRAQELKSADLLLAAWKKHPVLGKRTIRQLADDLKIGEAWESIPEFRNKDPLYVKVKLLQLNEYTTVLCEIGLVDDGAAGIIMDSIQEVSTIPIKLSPSFIVGKRLSGIAVIETFEQAALIIDIIEWCLTGNAHRTATKAMKQTWKKIAEGLWKSGPIIKDGLAKGWSEIVEGVTEDLPKALSDAVTKF